MAPILVTGAAGFIGFHVARRLLDQGERVVGLDNLNEYYDVQLKRARLQQLTEHPGFAFHRVDLSARDDMHELLGACRPRRIVHLAAQAGVRYSVTHPHEYIASNVAGFLNILEGCRQQQVEHLVYASSSSVYGGNGRMPFSVQHNVDHPLSLYAASKKANELMAHSYSWLYGLPTTGLRFFTVYGPWGRPDMAIFMFTKAILEGKPIELFNQGKMLRDFTYVDDIVEGVIRVLDKTPEPNPDWCSDQPDPGSSPAPYRLYNIGNQQPVELSLVIDLLEKSLRKKAARRLVPMQPGDVPATWADVEGLVRDVGFRPAIPIEEGIPRFVTWYRSHYRV